MVRQLIFSKSETKLGTNLSLNTNMSVKTSIMPTVNVDKELRKKRNKSYMELCGILDSNGSSLPQQYIDDIVNKIKDLFEEFGIPEDSMPVAIISKCYLGENFEVHKLDMIGNILCHFRDFQKMDLLSERARNLSQNKNYDFIEVYNDCLRAIHIDGSVSELNI